MDEFLTTNEIAKLLKVHVITVRRWIDAGGLKAARLGKQYRVKKEDLDKFLYRKGEQK